MPVIYFNSEKSLNFLIRNSVIYTLRANPRRTGRAWICSNGRKVGIAVVEYVKKVEISNVNELERYASLSGFNSVQEWVEKVKSLNKRVPNVL